MPPPSEVEDSMPYNNISIAEFSTPTRILEYFLQNAGPASENSQQTQRRQEITVYEGGEDLAGLTAGVLFGPAQPQDADGATKAGPQAEPTQHQDRINGTTVHEGDEDFTSVLVHGKGVAGREPYAGPQPALPSSDGQILDEGLGFTPETVEVRRSTSEPQQEVTSEDQMDVTHVTQTPFSALRKRKIPNAQPSPLEEPHSESPFSSLLGSENYELEPYHITIPSTFAERADSEPPPSKRLKTDPARETHALRRSASDVLPRISKDSPAALQETTTFGLVPNSYPEEDWHHLTELLSPEPPAANNRCGTQAPHALETLAEKGDLPSRYKPVFPDRPPRAMRPFERGYWHLALDNAGWSRNQKVKAWGFLGNYICRDLKAGWGTRACRDPGWRWMRLYGWEHIAGHLYILLYFASFRRAKLMDIWWFDGAGEALMVVRARGEQDTPIET